MAANNGHPMNTLGGGHDGLHDVPSAGGGGGGGNAWKDWTELPIDPTASSWKRIYGTRALLNSSTLEKVGDEMHYTCPTSIRQKIQGATLEGTMCVQKAHLTPWTTMGVPIPAGEPAHFFQPEAFVFKLEVEFVCDGLGPIGAGGVAGVTGQNLAVCAGLVGYKTDQSNDPGFIDANTQWFGAFLEKNGANANPSASTSTTEFKAGYRTYWSTANVTGGYTWVGQSSAGSTSHDSIVLVNMPMRKSGVGAGVAGHQRTNFMAGSYARTAPYKPLAMSGNVMFDESTQRMVDDTEHTRKYWHIFLAFGTRSNTGGGGKIKIKKIRYLLQPLTGRADLT
jgi:hypothetical protein